MAGCTNTVQIDEAQIDKLFASLNHSAAPGAAVGIAIRGRPVYRKGFGLANLELPLALLPSTRMRIASTSKHFTCLAYLLSCERGGAKLDDPIGKYVPEIHHSAHEITVRQLMTHVSGLRDTQDVVYHFNGTGHAVTTKQFLRLYETLESVNFSPGTGWCYNNGAYVMLSAIIERMTNQPLEDVLRERIFEPVGMYDTMLRRWDTDFVSNSATLHMTTKHGGFDKSYVGKEHAGEGGIVSTVDDILRWLDHMEHPIVGAARTWELMKQPQMLANGFDTGYGLGLIIDCYRGVETLSHAGSLMGCNSQVLKVPSAGLDIVVLVNRQDVASIALGNKILDACLPNLTPIETSQEPAFATGTFYSHNTGRIVQLLAKSSQQVLSIDGWDLAAAPARKNELRPSMGLYRFSVTTAGDFAAPSEIVLNDFGTPDRMSRVEPNAQGQIGSAAGSYECSAIGARLDIAETTQGVRCFASGPFGSLVYALENLTERAWRADSLGAFPLSGVLMFSVDGRSVNFSNGRTRSLNFQRAS